MAVSGKPYAYSKMEKEDPEERIHRRAQFLIYKVLDQADYSRRRQSWLRLRISKLKVKIGTRLRRFRKKLLSGVPAPKPGFPGHLKAWRRLLCRARNLLQQPFLLSSNDSSIHTHDTKTEINCLLFKY